VRLSSLDEQVVVVTGASSGIGRETAVRLARRGARVVVSAGWADDLADVVREIEHDGGHAVAHAADVAVPEEMVRLAAKAVEEHGAGGGPATRLLRRRRREWSRGPCLAAAEARLRGLPRCHR
jgi:NAD(P)-dependent dehydrogenase (short-subunit alcohol dehydrogenase family)